MRKFLPLLAIVGLAATPAMAQTAPEERAHAKTKMVQKTVCERIAAERTTGSRFGSTTKVCKTVEVPANENDKKRQPTQEPQGHSALAH